MLTPSGSLIQVRYSEIKSVCFVKDFDLAGDAVKAFQSRPKMEGLWVRMKFRDGDLMDGILPNQPAALGPLRLFRDSARTLLQQPEGFCAAGGVDRDQRVRGGWQSAHQTRAPPKARFKEQIGLFE